MQKIRRVSAVIIAICLLFSFTATAFAETDSAGLTVESQQLAGKCIDIAELKIAVEQNDTDKLVDMLMTWLGDYFRQNGLKEDFGYFNAGVYLSTYQDVNAAFNGDKHQALEHYIAIGAKEGRISGGEYDLPLAVRLDPSFLLNPDILNAMVDPESFLNAAGKYVKSITKGNISSGVISDEPFGPGSYTLMIYGSADNLDIVGDFMTGIMALYGTENINVVLTLGGSYKWYNDYLSNLLGRPEGSDETRNKTGFFMINVSELNSALDQLSEETGIPVSDMISKVKDGSEEGNELKKKVNTAVYSEKVMPLIEGTSVSCDAPIGSEETLKTMLELAKTNFPADAYALTFTGHGGGATGCLHSSDKTPGVDSKMIDAALSSAGFGEDNRMSFIAFDSCAMGCIETIAVLGKYCDYMYGSEALQPGNIEMDEWINAVKENLNTSDLSKAVAYAVYEMRANVDELLPTAAISDSAYAQEVLDAINQWSEAMLTAMKGSEKDKYFQALKKASVYSFHVCQGANSFDLKDFMQQVMTSLNDQGIYDMDAKIYAVIDAADALSMENSIGRYYKFIFDSNKGGLIQGNEEYRDEHLKYDFCGFSILFPDNVLTRLAKEATGDIQNHINKTRKELTDQYISKYENLGLKQYTELLNEYLDHYFTIAEAERIKNLSKEMTSCSSKNGNVTGYKDIASVKWNEDKTFVQVDIKDYSQESIRSKYSSGDVYTDIIETAGEFRAYLTSKLAVTGDKGTKNVDMVFLNGAISYDNMHGYQNRIELQLNSFICNSERLVSYVEKNGVQWADTDYLDVLIDPEQVRAYTYKEDVLAAAVNEISTLVDNRAAKEKEYEKEKTDANKKAYDEAYAKLSEEVDNYTIYYGRCTSSTGETTNNAFLIFKKDSNDNLVYCGAAKKTGSNESGDTYEKVKDLNYISFYHYEFSNVLDENNKDTGVDRLTAIETNSDYKGSYYDNSKYAYDVTDSKDIIIKTVKLYPFINLEKNYIDADNLGYYMTLTNADNQTVILNSKDGTQNKALSDEKYTTPLTQGQLKAILGTQSVVESEEPKEIRSTTNEIEEAEEQLAEEQPTAEEPVVDEPAEEEPTAEEPVIEEQVIEVPVAEESAVEEPVAEEPIAEESAVEEPAVEESVAEESAVEEPEVEESAVEEPAVEEPVVEEPAE